MFKKRTTKSLFYSVLFLLFPLKYHSLHMSQFASLNLSSTYELCEKTFHFISRWHENIFVGKEHFY